MLQSARWKKWCNSIMADPNNRPLITVCPREDFARVAAINLVASITEKLNQGRDQITWVPPTGNTPAPVYDYLAKHMMNQFVSEAGNPTLTNLWRCVNIQQLDERAHETAFADDIRNLAKRLKIPKQRISLINGAADDLNAEVARYSQIVFANPADIICLGLGAHDGHIAFNQPGSVLGSETRLVDLTDETQNQQNAYGDGAAASQGITQGMYDLLIRNRHAKMFLWASGEDKAEMLGRAMNADNWSIDVPANMCRIKGAKLHVICDEDAARDLEENHPNYDLGFH